MSKGDKVRPYSKRDWDESYEMIDWEKPKRCPYCGDDMIEPYRSCCGEVHFEHVCKGCDEIIPECTCKGEK